MNLEKEIFDIALDDIMPNRFQPREMFDEQALNELALSIKEHGVVQPITVRKVGDKYEIIAGERRFRASKLAGKKTIPALVKNYDDKEAAKVALIENLQRKDLTPIEEARTYQTILKLDNLTQEELANDLGKAQSTVANKLRLLNLDDTVQTALLNEKISERHARSLLNIESKEKQKELLEKTIQNRLTVRQLDELIALENGKVPDTEEDLVVEQTISEEEPKKEVFNKETIEVPLTKQEPATKSSTPIDPFAPTTPIKESILEEPKQTQSEEQQTLNIFDRLRQDDNQENTLQTDNFISKEQPKEETEQNPYANIYDLRFAINNVRQAIQNTEKFGFQIQSEEFDFDNVYQFVIKIDKEKTDKTI